MYGYKSVGDPQCLWTFTTKDSVLALTTELEGGMVKKILSLSLFLFSIILLLFSAYYCYMNLTITSLLFIDDVFL